MTGDADRIVNVNDTNDNAKVFDKLSIISVNCRGFTSKRSSIMHALDACMPDVAFFQETYLQNKKQPRIKGYTTVMKNRSVGAGGGVLTLIDKRLVTKSCVTALGDDESEFITIRLDLVNPAITLINYYGNIERNVEETSRSWDKILIEMAKAKARGDQVIIFGDFNRHLGERTGVEDKLSYGGKLVNDLLDDEGFALINNLPGITRGGPYTRQDPANPENKSVLTLAIASPNLVPYVESFNIDSARKFSPVRVIKRKTGIISKPSDHYLCELILKNLPNIPAVKKEKRWFYAKPGGWEAFKKLTEEAAKDVTKLLNNCQNLEVDVIDRRISRIFDRCKWKAFGKRTCYVSGGAFKEGNRKKNEEADLLRMDLAEFQEALFLMRAKGPRMGQIWELRKFLFGGKVGEQIPSAVIDPETGTLQVDVESIKRATATHIANTLRDAEPIEEFKHVVKERDDRHEMFMGEEKEERIVIQKQAMDTVIKRMIKSNKKGYKDIISASPEYHDALFKFYCLLTDREEVPKSFGVTHLTQLYKKGDPTSLDNWRYIHCKPAHVRLFEGTLTEMCKPFILDGVSEYQIGGIEGHRPSEHLYTMKTVLRNREIRKQATWVSLFDLKKFFDVQANKDAMEALHQVGVTGPLYRMVFKICARNILIAKTPVGETRPFTVGPIIAQGSSMGALVSALNLDRAVFRAFTAILGITMTELGIPNRPYVFQDDLSKLSANREEVQATHNLIYKTLSAKTLVINTSKCKVLICGKTVEAKVLKFNYDNNPITTGPDPTKRAECEKYLGDFLDEMGVRESWQKTILSRSGKLRGAVAETIALVQDFKSTTIGPVSAGVDLWEGLCLPGFLYNCGSWIHMTKSDFAMLEKFQTNFLRRLLKCPRYTSPSIMRWETGMLTMKMRIMKEKIMLVDHILNSESSSLALVIYEASCPATPGLKKEVEEFMCEHEIRSRDPYETRNAYKNYIKRTIMEINAKEDMTDMSNKSRTRYLAGSKPGRQSYLTTNTLSQARFIFSCRSGTIGALYGNNYLIEANARGCPACNTGETESQTHILDCRAYADLKTANPNLMTNSVDVACFWKMVLDRRARILLRQMRATDTSRENNPSARPDPAPD